MVGIKGGKDIRRLRPAHLSFLVFAPRRLEYFWEKLVPGAIVLFDDYGWSGYINQKKAHDAFAASKGVKILNLPTGQGMLIKP